MKEIINIAMASPIGNYDETFQFLGETFRVKRLGTDFNLALAKELIDTYRDKCDFIAISGLPNEVKTSRGLSFLHPQIQEVFDHSAGAPVVNGRNLRGLYIPWCLDQFEEKNGAFFKGKRIGFYSGFIQKSFLEDYSKLSKDMVFADPYFLHGIPTNLVGLKGFNLFLNLALPSLKIVKLNTFPMRDFRREGLDRKLSLKAFLESDIFVVNEGQLDYIRLNNLKNKYVIVDHIDKQTEKVLKAAGARYIINCLPSLLPLKGMGFAVLEAMLRTFKPDKGLLNNYDLQLWVEELELDTHIENIQNNILSQRDHDKFSFIIHPLSSDQILKHPILRPFRRVNALKDVSERAFTAFQGFKYGTITGIKSEATGKEIQGSVYAIGETPKMMMKASPERIYRKLVKIIHDSFDEGCKIGGLGAYTKIVGDAGVTVARRSPIPVTTGNTLSAASTLWAASLAIDKMNLVKRADKKYMGTAIVIGATGSIGKVTAKVLSNLWDRIILVAPKEEKLIKLAQEIRAINSSVEILYTTDSNKYLGVSDLVITTTSAQGKRILDINQVKPGAVICDVSRPFDIPEEDMIKRPDVLVIASGEVELPGDVKVSCDIGLHGNTVYACLAETALLTLEGRYESFSLSRDLDYHKVLEIDKMARKHGVRLSSIMGHHGHISDDEIELCRQHALKRLNLHSIDEKFAKTSDKP